MKITLALTTRLIAIMAVCSITIVALLVMLGFELGLRQAHEDDLARTKARGDGQQAATLPAKGQP